MWTLSGPFVIRVGQMAHKVYKEKEEDDISIRLITDHIRSATFMISDGIMPSNEGRGYVLRRIIRRAARHGSLLGIEGKFLAELSKTVIEGSKDGYPELEEKKDFILNVLTQEEDKFSRTIDQVPERPQTIWEPTPRFMMRSTRPSQQNLPAMTA